MTDSVKVNMNFQTSYCHAIDKSSPVVLTLSTASCLSQSETELLLLPAAGPRTVFPFPMMSNLPDHCRYSDRNFKIICFYFAIISKKLQHLTFHGCRFVCACVLLPLRHSLELHCPQKNIARSFFSIILVTTEEISPSPQLQLHFHRTCVIPLHVT